MPTVLTTSELIEAFERNVTLVKMQTRGLTHEDSLRQPPFRGNCLNWVLGHVLRHRDKILVAAGAEPVFGPRATRYDQESEPITGDEPDVVPLSELLDLLDRSQHCLATTLAALTPADLAQPVQSGKRTIPLSERVFFLYFHEVYHTGQTELLRQLAGTDDKVI